MRSTVESRMKKEEENEERMEEAELRREKR